MQIALPKSSRARTTTIVLSTLAAVAIAAGWWLRVRNVHQPAPHASLPVESAITHVAHAPDSATSEVPQAIDFPRESWQAASIEMQPVRRDSFATSVELTGKIALNEDRLAHVYPLVEGRVDEVRVQFGDQVKRGDLLVTVQSKEVGQAMTQLFEDRLKRDIAVTKDRWTQSVAANTRAMIELIESNTTIDEIEKQLQNHPLGEYRDTLMTAYINHYKSRQHFDRLAPLAQGGAVTGKQLLEAEANWTAARATLRSLTEQIQQDVKQASILSTQSVKELETRVAVDETNLMILGFQRDALAGINPATQGEAISHYPIFAPFDGTIISKDAVLLERVGPESQLLSIADLSTVWVSVDIYEEHLPLLKKLRDQTIHFHSVAWPDKTFTAKVFYTGDVIHESTRTISLRAIAENKDRLLKPGMFVNIQLPSLTEENVLQLPATAIQEHEGKSFVFVHQKEDSFERRNVTIGRRNAAVVEIQAGLQPGDMVVTNGGFALKSQMLAELLSED